MESGQSLPNDVLRELVLGERTSDDPGILDAFAANPELRRRWEEFSRTTRLLNRTAGWERSTLEAAVGSAPLPEAEAAVERVLREAARRSVWRRRTWMLALAAGLLFVAYLSIRAGRNERDPGAERGYLGSPEESPILVEPLGAALSSELSVFRWTLELDSPREGHCRVAVYDDEGAEILRSPEIRAPVDGASWEWRPTQSEQRTLREARAFVWQVSFLPLSGSPVSSAPQPVSLQS